MVYGIIGAIIGICVLGAGLYFLKKDKDDAESKKIYGITSAVGAVITVASAVAIILNIL